MSYNKKALRVDLGKYYKPDPYKKDITIASQQVKLIFNEILTF